MAHELDDDQIGYIQFLLDKELMGDDRMSGDEEYETYKLLSCTRKVQMIHSIGHALGTSNCPTEDEFSKDYPLGGSIEPYDIERENNLTNE